MPKRPSPRETKLAAKKGRILNEVFRSSPTYRVDLARQLNINATMVGSYVDEFVRAGMLVEDEPTQSRPGRAPVPLRTNRTYGCFLGVDFEALRCRAVLCDFAGDSIHQEEVDLEPGATREEILEAVVGLARRVADRATAPMLCVGVAAPGQVDCLAGRILDYPLISDFAQVPVRDRFERVFDVPVFIEDNMRAVAYAELMRGSGRGCEEFLCMAVRSGVGLGIVIDGQPYGGSRSMGGELAYTVLSTAEGPRYANDLVSTKGFLAATRQLLRSWQTTEDRRELLEMGDKLSLSAVTRVAEHGDPLLLERLADLGWNLGILAANLANLFAPEKIVLAGEVPNCATIVRQTMERTFREFTLPHILQSAYLEDGTLGPFAGALGAAWLGFRRRFPEDEQLLIERPDLRKALVDPGYDRADRANARNRKKRRRSAAVGSTGAG